jgi:Squalene-hopene cyclase C-terminal domain
MRIMSGALLLSGLLLAASFTAAQPPGGDKGGKEGGRGRGPGRFGGPPRPGQILPDFLQDELRLTDEQKKQLADLQKEVDAKLEKILTEEQKKQLRDLRDRRPPPGFGPPGFPGRNGPPGRPPDDPPPPPAASKDRDKPRDVVFSQEAVREAVEKSLPMLWKGIDGHTDHRTCFTCHSHGVPLLAVETARDHGFGVSEAKLREQLDFITDHLESLRGRLLRGAGPGPFPIGGRVDTTGYALLALDAVGRAPDATTAAVVEYTLREDWADDYRRPAPNRPPQEHSRFTTTYLGIRSLQKYGQPEHAERIAQRVEAARGWLLRTPARDTEDRVFRLLGLRAAGAEDPEVRKAARELAESQRADGGWGQLDTLDSDAYATGSALVALHLAGGLATDDPAYRRGLTFLLGTQHEDGSWWVPSRSRPIQRYFESGFPHGRDQFISIAASGWATTALALACPTRKPSGD